jgi:hypothetical protein
MATGPLVQHCSNRPSLEATTSRTGEAGWPCQAIKKVSAFLF